jgi:hypothetical protein
MSLASCDGCDGPRAGTSARQRLPWNRGLRAAPSTARLGASADQLRRDAARRATRRWCAGGNAVGCSVREGQVRYVYPWAAGRKCGIARLTSAAQQQPAAPTPARGQTTPCPSQRRGCASNGPVAAGARLTRPKVCLASSWNHLAAVDLAHGMLHK